jgi:hypothetical protein
MLPNAKSFRHFALLLAALAGWQASALRAQAAPSRPWTLTASFTALSPGGGEGWFYGPELGIRRDFGAHLGVGLRAALPVFETDPGTDDGAAAIDLGPTLTFRGARSEFGLAAGATGFLVGGGGELIDGGIGGFASGHATAWLTQSLGAVAGATVRISGSGEAYPSLSAGLTVRF